MCMVDSKRSNKIHIFVSPTFVFFMSPLQAAAIPGHTLPGNVMSVVAVQREPIIMHSELSYAML